MKNTVIKELTESIHDLSLYELNNSLKWYYIYFYYNLGLMSCF